MVSRLYLPNPLALPALLFHSSGAIPAKFLGRRSKRQLGVPAAPAAFLLMGTLLGQLPFPGAGGEGSAAGGAGSDPWRCQERLDVWLPLPLLRIAKPLPRGTADSWQGGTGQGASSQPEILARGHLPFLPGCVGCQRQAQPRGVSQQLPMSCTGREPAAGAGTGNFQVLSLVWSPGI